MSELMKLNTLYGGSLKLFNPLTRQPVTGKLPGDFAHTVYSNDSLSLDPVMVVEILPSGNGEYYWTHTATELGYRKIMIETEIIISGITFRLSFPFSFEVVKNDLQDVYDKIDSLAAGEGSEPVIIYAKETGSELPIPEVDYEIWDESNSVRLHSGEDSNNNGNQEFNLNPGNYKVKLRKPYWNFPFITDLIVLTGGTELTIHGDRLLPSVPSDPNLCVVYGYAYGVNGQKLPGAGIVAELSDLSAFKNSIKIAEMTNEASSNEEGYFELELIPNSKLEPEGSRYSFKITKDGIYLWTVRGTVPDQASAQFRDIIDLSEIDC